MKSMLVTIKNTVGNHHNVVILA